MCGYLGDVLDLDQYPERTGYILGGAVMVSYLCCAPLFIITAHLFSRLMKDKAAAKKKKDNHISSNELKSE